MFTTITNQTWLNSKTNKTRFPKSIKKTCIFNYQYRDKNRNHPDYLKAIEDAVLGTKAQRHPKWKRQFYNK